LPPPTTIAIWVRGRVGEQGRTSRRGARLNTLALHGGHLASEVQHQVGVDAEASLAGQRLAGELEQDAAPAAASRRRRDAHAEAAVAAQARA